MPCHVLGWSGVVWSARSHERLGWDGDRDGGQSVSIHPSLRLLLEPDMIIMIMTCSWSHHTVWLGLMPALLTVDGPLGS